jgi:predicted TIM-barrel fold metal-dependent hydrolase
MTYEIVDSQVHVWTASTPERPWTRAWDEQTQRELAAGSSRTGGAPFEAGDLLREMAGAGVARAILVPPGFQGDQNDYALGCAQEHPGVFRVMGRIDLRLRREEAWIRRDVTRPGMLGYRLTFLTPALRESLASGGLEWFWTIADSLGIPITLIAPGLLGPIEAVARRHPTLRISLDHLNLTSTAANDDLDALIARTCELATLPNVAVKASAIPSFANDPYPFVSAHGHIRRVVEAFGPERVFWGTDFSRLPPACSYRQAVTLFTTELDFLSATDVEWIMGRGVMRWYGWTGSG